MMAQSSTAERLNRWADMLERLARPVIEAHPEAITTTLHSRIGRSTSAIGPLMLHCYQTEQQQQQGRSETASSGSQPSDGAANGVPQPPSKRPLPAHQQPDQPTGADPDLNADLADLLNRPPVAAKEDVALWWIVLGPDAESRRIDRVEQIIELSTDRDASLFDQGAYRTIEVWTETELAALHALSHLANLIMETDRHSRDRDRIARRVRQLIAWHIDRTQPDNATNHPWALHAFVHADTPESMHFAETLVSNCQVQTGQPDYESAWIMLDSANALREAAAGSRATGT